MKDEEGSPKYSKRDASPPGVVTMAMLACKKITPRRLTPGLSFFQPQQQSLAIDMKAAYGAQKSSKRQRADSAWQSIEVLRSGRDQLSSGR